MQQKVILLGPGNVGRTFIQQVLKYDGVSAEKHSNPTVIVGVVTPSSLLFNAYGLSDERLQKVINDKDLKGDDLQVINNMTEVLDKVEKAGLNGEVVFVDATAAKDAMKDFHLQIIEESDNGVVTANKNPVSLYDTETYKRLTKNLRYQYTTTVMAGSGIVRFLRGTRKISDQVHSIQGMFSGTLGFITSELDKGRKISEIVKEAKENGYTEPNPWDDLNGLDVARKLVILARGAGFNVTVQDIDIQAMLPEKYGKLESVDAFLEGIKEEDESFMKKVGDAEKEGKVLRYVAELEYKNNNLKLFVGLKSVLKDSPLGRLSGTANFVQVITDVYTESNPYILQTPGAGLPVTAASLRKDLLSFLPQRLGHSKAFSK